MRFISMLSVLCLAIVPSILAQETSSDDLVIFATKYGRNATPKYADLKGSPYLNEDFTMGELESRDGEIVELNLRLNAFADELEFKTNHGIVILTNPELMSRIVLGESEYIYVESNNPQDESAGYFKKITGDNYKLLSKHRVVYMSSVAAGAYEPATKAELRKEPDSYFLSILDQEVVKLKRKKKFFLELFPDKQELISKYIKEEKISLIKEKDLINLVDYLNKIQ